jgi:hypothetical protein
MGRRLGRVLLGVVLLGVGLLPSSAAATSHFVIDGVDVHDVTGEVNWIGGDPAGNKPGVTFQTGWGRSKNTGGIVVKQHTGSSEGAVKTGWGERANATDPRFIPHTNVVIRNNFVQQDGNDYALGRWYDVGLVVGTVNERFDLFIDGTRISDDQRFRTAMPAVAGIAFYANSSNYGSAYVDDVRISYGS